MSILLAACANRHSPVVRVTPSSIPGNTLSSEGIESVRYSENIKTYPIGRYIDPNNPWIMHEGHSIYRVETTTKWNLHPNQPDLIPLGPIARLRDSSKTEQPIRDELLVELNRQKETTKTMIQSGQAVSQKFSELTDAVQKTQQIAGQNTQLQKEINTTKQRLESLEEELSKKQSPQRRAISTEAPKQSKSPW